MAPREELDEEGSAITMASKNTSFLSSALEITIMLTWKKAHHKLEKFLSPGLRLWSGRKRSLRKMMCVCLFEKKNDMRKELW